MKYVLVFLFFMDVSFPAHAEGNWYIGVSNGTINIRDGIRPSHTEQQIMSHTEYTRSVEQKSSYNSFSLGRCFDAYVCGEVAYFNGVQFRTKIALSSLKVGTIAVLGHAVNVGNLPSNTIVEQEADVALTQISLIGRVPVNQWFDVFGRAGIYQYRVREVAKIPLPYDLYLMEENTERGSMPMLSVGFDVKNKKTYLRFEGQKTGPVSIYSIGVGYMFE